VNSSSVQRFTGSRVHSGSQFSAGRTTKKANSASIGVILTLESQLGNETRLAVHSDPAIMGGTPVFVGTRVPFQALIDYLEAGDPLSAFLEDFPTVSRELAITALDQAKDALLARAHSA
jgi:uncharacterized protein (DUF433 family)